MHREIGKESFLEAFLPEGIGRNDSLERIGWTGSGRVGRGYLRGRGGKAKLPAVDDGESNVVAAVVWGVGPTD